VSKSQSSSGVSVKMVQPTGEAKSEADKPGQKPETEAVPSSQKPSQP